MAIPDNCFEFSQAQLQCLKLVVQRIYHIIMIGFPAAKRSSTGAEQNVLRHPKPQKEQRDQQGG